MHQDFERFVLAHVPSPPATILEIGCGAGDLARGLAAAGHLVTAIDPEAPEGPLFRPVTLEELDETRRFDAVVASRSFHHVPDLDAAVAKIDSLLVPGAVVVLDDYAKERFDGRTAAWFYAHRRRSLADGGGPAAPASLEKCVCECEADDSHIHGLTEMRAALARRFGERVFVWVPYLWRDLEGSASRVDEQAAIDAGSIAATGFRYVGRSAR